MNLPRLGLICLVATGLQCGIADAAGAHVTITGSHASITVTGFDFPTDGSKVYVNVYGGTEQIWIGSQVVTPNQTKLTSPPCFVVCDKGEFIANFSQIADPCAGPHRDTFMKISVKWGTTRKPDRTTWGTVSCPVANAPIKHG